jgi:hypothetical protein
MRAPRLSGGGRLRLRQAPRFLRTSARAEARVVDAPGLAWATALARSAFVRFRPTVTEGGLDGRNPLAQTWPEGTPRSG